jgi:hypothetical protein
MLQTTAAAMHRSHAEKGMHGKGEDWKRRNEVAAAEKCEAARKGVVVDVETETDLLALPDLEDPLREKVEQIMTRHTKAFAKSLRTIMDTFSYREAIAELHKLLSDHATLIMEQNTRRWHQSLAPVSVAAAARMRLNVSCTSAAREAWSDWSHLGQAAWICYRDSLPWVCDAHATTIWVEEFESARRRSRDDNSVNLQNMTDSMVHEVAEVFLTSDLASHRDAVRSRFNALVAAFVMLVTGGAYVWWQVICSRRLRAKTDPIEDSMAERISAAATRPAPWIPNPVFTAAEAPLPNDPDESMDLCEGVAPVSVDDITVGKIVAQIALVSKDDSQAARFFSDLHADPTVNRLIEKAGWTHGVNSNQTPRRLADWHDGVIEYVKARTCFAEDSDWLRMNYVDGVLSRYTSRI